MVQERVSTQYLRRLGLFDGIMMTVGGIIGAGIFLNPSIVAARTGSPGLTLGAWVLGGVIALTGALCFAELGSRFPEAGGGYVYLRDAFGRLPAFLYGWTLLLVINSGALAAVATIAAGYSLELAGLSGGRTLPLALGFILLFTAVNYFGIRPGAAAQNLFTLLKLAALALVIVVGGLMTVSPPAAGPSTPAPPTDLAGAVLALATALIPVMFATGGWQNSNFIAAEVRDPQRILPRAILGGVMVVVTVYVLVNAAYLRALGVGGLAASGAPAAETVRATLGNGAGRLVSLGVVFSTLGILNLFILAAPRVYQAMADDGLFFRAASYLHPRYRTPSGALLFQAGWAGLLATSGTYGQLLDYVVFGDWIFFGSVAATLWVYRRRERAEDEREAGIFRTPAFHLVAGTFVGAAVCIVAASVYSNPGNALLGALLIASGMPVFRFWERPTMSLDGSAYIRWAKSRERFRFNLGRSSIRGCPEELLGVRPEELRLAGSNAHGWPPLVDALADRYGVPPSRVQLAPGCSMANHLVMATLLESGSHVLAERPGYAPLTELPTWLGAEVEPFDRTEDWRLDPGEIERRLRPETRLLVLTDPHNPTGAVADPETLDRIGKLAERHGFHVLVDEVYREFTYRPGEEIAARRGALWISTCSLTKAYGLDGIRVGWMIAAGELIDRARALNDLYGIIMPHPSERLALRAVERIDALRRDVDDLLARNRPLVEALIGRRSELEWLPPPAGPIGFVRLRGGRVARLLEILERDFDTTLTPGHLFGREDHFRMGFGMPTTELEAALPGLEQALDRLPDDAGARR